MVKRQGAWISVRLVAPIRRHSSEHYLLRCLQGVPLISGPVSYLGLLLLEEDEGNTIELFYARLSVNIPVLAYGKKRLTCGASRGVTI